MTFNLNIKMNKNAKSCNLRSKNFSQNSVPFYIFSGLDILVTFPFIPIIGTSYDFYLKNAGSFMRYFQKYYKTFRTHENQFERRQRLAS